MSNFPTLLSGGLRPPAPPAQTAPVEAGSARIELQSYAVTIPLGSLAVGIDNIHHDVFLSPRFVQMARGYLLHLIRQSTKATFFSGIELRPSKEVDFAGFPKVLGDLLQASLTLAKFQKNIELDLLCRIALIKFLTQEIAAQFANLILEGKEWIRQRGEHFERSEQAHVIKARLAELQAGRKNVTREVGQQIRQFILDAEENLLCKSRRALFGDDFAELYDLLKNPLVFLDGGKDEIFFLKQYVLLGNYVHDPDRFESIDTIFQELLRDSVLSIRPDAEFDEARQAHDRTVQQALALRSEIASLEEERDGLHRKLSRGEGVFGRLLSSPEPSNLRAALSELEMRLKHRHTKLEEMGPELDAARQKLDFVIKQHQGRLGDYLNAPENARRLFDPSGTGESAQLRSRLLDELTARLERQELLLHVMASYEIRSIYQEYCPPVHLQQLRRALVSREEMKRVEDILKQFPARRLSIRSIDELSRKIRRFSPEELRAGVLRFAEDFFRLHRDLRNAEHLAACMERVNLVANEQTRNVSRMNNTLYEFLLPEEARPQQDRVLSHAIIKADVRGSTKITQDLIGRGLNPASHFSLHLHEPVKRLLERYDARKVFIEGDAIILAIYETESNQSFQRAVAKACVLARQILAVSNAYNDRAESGDLPRLELGLGVAFQGSAPTYWMDGESRIMISRALNLSDRLSGCAKLTRRLLAGQSSHFSVFQFVTAMEGISEEEADEFLVRFNLNGVELNEEGYQKLSEEISLETIETKLEMPWGKEPVILYYGEVPIGESIELLVLRKGFARELLPDGRIGRRSDHVYYEVCTSPALYALVEALLRTAAHHD
jgi:hypothetical protein